MKRTVSLLLTAVLLLSLALPAGAKVILPPLPLLTTEHGYTYTVEETEEGKTLSGVRYTESEEDTAYVPKTLGGVPVTTDNLDGTAFLNGPAIAAFAVDEDNTQFSVRDGLLFSKDGKTLIAVPNAAVRGIVRIPDGVEALGTHCLDLRNPPVEDEKGVCVCIPASVTSIAPDFVGGKAPAIAGEANTAAEAFAAENGLPFLLLGEGHTHTYFRCVTEATCLQGGEVLIVCPCGVVVYGEALPPLEHEWSWHDIEKEDGRSYREVYCVLCGEVRSSRLSDSETFEDCDCRCHKINRTWAFELTKENWKEVLQNVIFRFQLAYWHLIGINQYCACGARHF